MTQYPETLNGFKGWRERNYNRFLTQEMEWLDAFLPRTLEAPRHRNCKTSVKQTGGSVGIISQTFRRNGRLMALVLKRGSIR